MCLFRFSDVYFIDASTAKTTEADLRTIALAKGIGDCGEHTLDWLAGQDEAWLLLLNNADDTTFNLLDYFPKCSHGNILITSRNRDNIQHASDMRSNYRVSGMGPDDARDLLLKISGLQEQEERTTGIEALATAIVKVRNFSCVHRINVVTVVQELGYLALAVVQAGAYILRTECGFGRYLEMYRERRGGLLEEYRGNIQKMDNYEWTVYTTWTISFKRLSQESATFLQLCAFLHYDGISEAIFRNAASNAITYAPTFPDPARESDSVSRARDYLGVFGTLDSPWDSQKFLKVITEIRSYSLVDFDRENHTYSIHPLVHAWTRSTISNDEATRACVQSILGMSINLESRSEDYDFRHSILAHIDTLLKQGTSAGIEFYGRFALVYHEGGRWKEAENLRVQVQETCLRVLGPKDLDTLTSMADLAATYRSQRRWKEAEVLEVQVKETRLEVLGAEHPHTLSSIGNLASAYEGQGRWKEAEVLYFQVMEACFKVFGPEHPNTLTSMGNLAMIYSNQGRLKEAEVLDVQVTEARLRVLGAAHPHTLMGMSNLASTYSSQGRWKEAEVLEFQIKEAYLKVLGAEHPNTLKSMGDLAATYVHQGRWKEAEELETHVKEASLRVLGAEHSVTLGSMETLAAIYCSQGRWRDAEALDVKVAEVNLRVLGPEHPDTLRSMGNLVSTYKRQGRWKAVEELEVLVMETRLRVLGEEHPHTLWSMTSLAVTYRNQGRLKDAEELEVQVMEARLRVLGAEHPDTLTSMANLAVTYRNQGQLKEAEELENQVKEASLRVLGAEHPDSPTRMEILASMYRRQGRWEEAKELEAQMKEIRCKVLGTRENGDPPGNVPEPRTVEGTRGTTGSSK